MKPQEQKTEFIRLRAEGKSYSYIAKELHISKGTCTAWEQEFKDTITELKQDQLNELYNSYYMTKEARIKKLGTTLNRINTALETVDFNQIAPDKLLDYKLKYTEALKGEYMGKTQPYHFTDQVNPSDIITALGDLFNRIRSGETTAEQANKESMVLSNLLKAYDTVEIKAKLDALESILESRR